MREDRRVTSDPSRHEYMKLLQSWQSLQRMDGITSMRGKPYILSYLRTGQGFLVYGQTPGMSTGGEGYPGYSSREAGAFSYDVVAGVHSLYKEYDGPELKEVLYDHRHILSAAKRQRDHTRKAYQQLIDLSMRPEKTPAEVRKRRREYFSAVMRFTVLLVHLLEFGPHGDLPGVYPMTLQDGMWLPNARLNADVDRILSAAYNERVGIGKKIGDSVSATGAPSCTQCGCRDGQLGACSDCQVTMCAGCHERHVFVRM